MCPLIQPGMTLLDVGCGSGILSIAAAKLSGITTIRCLDVDHEARRVTAENAADNGVSDRIEILEGILTHRTPRAELVVANILPHILLRLRGGLVTATVPGGLLLLSGIGLREERELTRVFSADLQPRGRRELDGWVALLFEHG